MKRSESVLIYGVTAVLAVILAVAIIFGGPDPATNKGPEDRLATAGPSELDDILPQDPGPAGTEVEPQNAAGTRDAAAPFDILDAVLNGETPVFDGDSLDGESLSGRAADGGENGGSGLAAEGGSGSGSGLMVPLRSVPELTIADLGKQRMIENEFSGRRYRFVTVERGDTLGGLLQRWCPGTDRATVAALNETVDLDRLRYNTEVCLPWYDDALLLDAFIERKQNPVQAVAQPASTAPSGAASGDGVQHTIGEGESLWTIAVAKVGAKKANAYIGKILDLNPGIVDASRVRAGNSIRLPE